MMNPFEVRVGDDETEEWGVNPSCGKYVDSELCINVLQINLNVLY